MNNFDSIVKIFTDCVQWAYKHLHVKYLSDQMNLKFSHKLTYNY